jgi:putative hydrolase of the HAD superfamily
MKYQAVIFDLFGTLVPNFSEREYHHAITQIASILSAPPDPFWQLWKNAFNERILGTLPDAESQILDICQKLRVKPDKDAIVEAIRIRFDYERHVMVPYPEAVSLLSTLKSEGYKTCLVTNCSSEAVAIWEDIALAPFFDVAIFSCRVGIKKPSPEIYHLAIQRLKIDPQYCVYIGDGSCHELLGASQIGLQAVHLRMPEDDNPDVFRVDQEDWQGMRVPSIRDLLCILK